jgi:hypothetical protein
MEPEGMAAAVVAPPELPVHQTLAEAALAAPALIQTTNPLALAVQVS